jgi:hypothetical protein
MRSQDAVIRVYDDAGNVIETHEQAGEFKAWWVHYFGLPRETAGATSRLDMQRLLADTR